jgi:hypothetical protein
MESITLGGRKVSGFSHGLVRPPQVGVGDENFFTKELEAAKQELMAVKRDHGGVFVPAWMAGASAGSSVALLVKYFHAPNWAIALGGVGTAIGVWAGLK